MKQVLRIILIFITFSTSYNLSGQVLGKFGTNQSTLDPNAVLEVESTSKGVLLPRLTTVQQNAMSAPTDGMLIYNTDSACFVLRRAGIWRSLCAANGGEAWSSLGNTGTNANTNFLGTTDAQALVVKTNNVERMRVSSTGNVGIGIATPAYALDVFAATNPMRLQGLANGASTDSILTIDPSTGLVRKSTMSAIKLTDLPLGAITDSFVVINDGYIRKLGIDDVIDTYAWSLDGNAGTIDGTNFIGTTDNIPFNIRVNNEKAGRIDNTNANAFFGYQSGNANTIGTNNTAMGDQALKVTTTGTNNVALGYRAGLTNTTGGNNTLIGYQANVSAAALSNATAIGYNAVVGASNSLVLGGTGADAVNVGIGTTTPSVKIDVDGALALRPSSTSITADNQAVTVSNRSFLRLTSDGTPANRTITLSNGLQDGQQLIIRVIGTGTNGIELADSGNLNLSGLAQLDDGDTLTLIWDGTIWYELYRSSN